MSDNLKTWPEKILIDTKNYKFSPCPTLWYISSSDKKPLLQELEYIRADKVKEREAKLIKAAYEMGCYENMHSSDLIEYDCMYDDHIYKDARLEELK